VLQWTGEVASTGLYHEDGGCGFRPLLEVLFQSAAKVFPKVENSSDHAMINSKGIVSYTARYLISVIPAHKSRWMG
jgi:hypothetical protein